MHGQTCSRTRIIAESAKNARNTQIRHLTCTGSLGPLVASQKRPGKLQVGHQADRTDRSSFTVELSKEAQRFHEGKQGSTWL